jgi:GT2 family glycosyltransferase
MNVNDKKKEKINLSIIIVNYNLAKEIENCLDSLLPKIKQLYLINYEIIIIDNNSPDKQLADVQNKYDNDNIKFYYLQENLGFGQACNFGYSKSSGKYLCFLNPDTLIKEDIFSPIINLFETDNTAGIIGPKQQVRKPFFDFSAGFSPNLIFEALNLFGIGVFVEGFLMFCYTKIIRKEFINVNWILGACLFIQADLFESLNGFDKDYFMFFEESDLCKRVIQSKYRVIYYPSIGINHIGSVSGKKDYYLYTIRTYSSKYIYISKHFKYFNLVMMKILLNAELFSQIIIWTFLFPFTKTKSSQKICAFIDLIKTGFKYEHRG